MPKWRQVRATWRAWYTHALHDFSRQAANRVCSAVVMSLYSTACLPREESPTVTDVLGFHKKVLDSLNRASRKMGRPFNTSHPETTTIARRQLNDVEPGHMVVPPRSARRTRRRDVEKDDGIQGHDAHA